MSGACEDFRIPKDGDVFINHIMDRCEGLIYAGIWEGLDTIRLRTWMNNFRTPTERYFAACVLDALIYRSNAQTFAMMKHLFQQNLPNILRIKPLMFCAEIDWFKKLRMPIHIEDAHIRIVPVIKSTDPPTKSGPLVCRYYRRELKLNQNLMIWPWEIAFVKSTGVNAFLFVDDFLGTGDQFKQFMDNFSINDKLTNTDAIYAPLVAHTTGIDFLRKNYYTPTHCQDRKLCFLR